METREVPERDERYYLSIEDGRLVCSRPNPKYDEDKGQPPALTSDPLIQNLPANHPYLSPCPYKLPIIGVSVIKAEFNDDESAKRDILAAFKECGFNTLCVQTSYKPESYAYYINLKDWFDSMCYVGTKLVVGFDLLFSTDESNKPAMDAKDSFLSLVKNIYIANNMLAAWLRDEPGVKQCCDIMKGYIDILQKYPDIMCVINLSSSTKDNVIGYEDRYSKYLDIIQAAFQPAVWSYDYYPVRYYNSEWINSYDGGTYDMCPGLIEPLVKSISLSRDEFYTFLEKISRISKRSQRPFWAFCESDCHFIFGMKNGMPEFNVAYPPATLPYLRIEAFSSLAYGAQGILYYKYWYHPANNVCSALLDEEGKKTSAWYAARQVNSEIRFYEDVFLGATMVSCKHLGYIPHDRQGEIRDEEKRLAFPFGPLNNMTIPKDGEGVLVSQLVNGSRWFLVVVSHSITDTQSINLYFKMSMKVTELTPTPLWTHSHENGAVTRTIAPGGYLIFEFG